MHMLSMVIVGLLVGEHGITLQAIDAVVINLKVRCFFVMQTSTRRFEGGLALFAVVHIFWISVDCTQMVSQCSTAYEQDSTNWAILTFALPLYMSVSLMVL